MDPISAIIAFSIPAALLTIVPGLDTALVVRTAAVEGSRRAMLAGSGVVSGCLVWGLIAALGLGAVLAMSEIGYRVLQIVGAGYLLWLGFGMLRSAFRPGGAPLAATSGIPEADSRGWFWRGLMTNLLNPKVGVFYVSFLPQFVPADVPVVAFSVGLATLHAAMGLAWFAVLVLAMRPLAEFMRRPVMTRTLDGLTGAVLVAFGIRLVLERRG